MTWLRRLLCRHRHILRERRLLHDVQIMHLVCTSCGHAVPLLDRSAQEHRDAIQVGTPKAMRAHQVPIGNVVAMGTRR